jgi:hypothetical protein
MLMIMTAEQAFRNPSELSSGQVPELNLATAELFLQKIAPLDGSMYLTHLIIVLFLFQELALARDRGPAMKRKGELSAQCIDKNWPHRIASAADQGAARPFKTIQTFCANLSLCPRTQSFRRDDRDYLVFSFAERADAEQFLVRFHGDWIDRKAAKETSVRPSRKSR